MLSHEIQECGNTLDKKKKRKEKVSFISAEDKETHFFDAISDHPSKPAPGPNPDPEPSPDPDPEPSLILTQEWGSTWVTIQAQIQE
jgi:hypothetical protein